MAMVKSLAAAIPQPDIDKARLMSVSVEPFSKMMKVQLAKGYESGEDFILKSASTHMISGDDYDELMDAMGDPAKALKDSLEEGIWAKLVAMGVIELA
jgi:hypothetical protein